MLVQLNGYREESYEESFEEDMEPDEPIRYKHPQCDFGKDNGRARGECRGRCKPMCEYDRESGDIIRGMSFCDHHKVSSALECFEECTTCHRLLGSAFFVDSMLRKCILCGIRNMRMDKPIARLSALAQADMVDAYKARTAAGLIPELTDENRVPGFASRRRGSRARSLRDRAPSPQDGRRIVQMDLGQVDEAEKAGMSAQEILDAIRVGDLALMIECFKAAQ